MVFRLTSQNDPDLTVTITRATWFEMLEIADSYAWNPLGKVLPGQPHLWSSSLAEPWLNGQGNGTPDFEEGQHCLVIMEDALNLGEVLEEAFLDHEPHRVPASYYLFEPANPIYNSRPGLGALAAVIAICQLGAFWIEELEFTQLLPRYSARTQSATERHQ